MRTKIFLAVFLLMLLSSTINAQKCAVFDFSAAKGISVSEVDGISEMFMTYFRPSGYRMVERAQIDKVISEQRYQRSNLTETQMVQMGKIMNASRIVVGKVSRLGGQYQVDVRVVSVETGHDIATEGATFVGDYRTNVKNLAQRLASKISITSSGGTLRKRTSVEIVQGYLKIFPEELGVFDSYPMNVIMQINNQIKYGYNNWRIPTNEELSLIRANGYLSNAEYMCEERKRGIVLLVTDGETYAQLQKDAQDEMKRQKEKAKKDSIALSMANQNSILEPTLSELVEELKKYGYVDLGLPSGTLWKNKNEEGLYVYAKAMDEFGSYLPSKEQWEELMEMCVWKGGYSLTAVGPSGESINLPAEGYKDCFGEKSTNTCSYWSSTSYDATEAWMLFYYQHNGRGKNVSHSNRCRSNSVRLTVKKDRHQINILILKHKKKQQEAEQARIKAEQEAEQARIKAEQEKLKHYIDLGLPSGTLWKDENEEGGFYTYEQAMAKFGNKLPTKEQCEELKNSCTWSWTGKGYKVIGPNGNFIIMPAAGYHSNYGSSDGGSLGLYWSSTPNDSGTVLALFISLGQVYMCVVYKYGDDGFSVRLVH